MHSTKQITYMQMLITKLPLFLCLILSLYSGASAANYSFNDEFQINPEIDSAIANRITEYYSSDISLTPSQQQTELKQLELKLKALEPKNGSKAVYWFIRGLHNRNMAAAFANTDQPSKVREYITKKNKAYERSLELSKDPSQLLSASIYNTMKAGLPQNLKIQATQAELQQGGSGDNESSYWYLHWSNVDQLKKAGREEEAEAAFKKMQKEMQDNKVDMSIYNDLNKQIEKQTFNKSDQDTSKQSQKQSKKSPKEESEKSTLFTKDMILNILLVLSIVSLILVTFYEFVIKKRK